MTKRSKARVLAVATAGLLALGAAGPATAQQPTGVAKGVVAAVVQVDRTLNNLQILSDVGSIEIITVKRSLNNALRNSPILSNNVITIQDFLNNCTVLSCFEITDVLNDLNVQISDVVAVNVLSGGDIIVYRR